MENGNHIVLQEKPHSHDANPIDVEEKAHRNLLKRKAEDTNDVPSKIIRNCAAESSTIVQTRTSKLAQRNLIKRVQEKKIRLNNDADSIDDFGIPEAFKKTISGESFLQVSVLEGDSKILIFTTKQSILKLASARYWIMDGTFSSCPNEFRQLYTIHAPIGQSESEKTVPLVYMLLSRKSQEIYTNALELLTDYAEDQNVQLQPKYILTDFEKAVINAIKEIFPGCSVFGCFFHWTQNLIKKLAFLGLKTKYSTETQIFMAVKKLQALSFLPPNRIKSAYFDLKPALPEILGTFLQYFEETYITGKNNNDRPMYHPVLWSNYRTVMEGMPKTTNFIESWHHTWAILAGTHHLSVRKMVDEIRKEQQANDGKILQILAGKTKTVCPKEIQEIDTLIYEKVKRVKEWSNSDFIEGISINSLIN